MQIFLVDDDYDDQEIFLMALHQVDVPATCSFASNGIEALEKLAENRAYVPDYIFIDINMPKMNGIECLREIKKLDHLKKSQILMYSTSADTSIIQQCLQLGADDFLVKPPGFTQLIELLRNLLTANQTYGQ